MNRREKGIELVKGEVRVEDCDFARPSDWSSYHSRAEEDAVLRRRLR